MYRLVDPQAVVDLAISDADSRFLTAISRWCDTFPDEISSTDTETGV